MCIIYKFTHATVPCTFYDLFFVSCYKKTVHLISFIMDHCYFIRSTYEKKGMRHIDAAVVSVYQCSNVLSILRPLNDLDFSLSDSSPSQCVCSIPARSLVKAVWYVISHERGCRTSLRRTKNKTVEEACLLRRSAGGILFFQTLRRSYVEM